MTKAAGRWSRLERVIVQLNRQKVEANNDPERCKVLNAQQRRLERRAGVTALDLDPVYEADDR